MPKRMLKGRLFTRRRKGQPCTRWLDNVVTDLVVRWLEGGEGRVEVVKEGKAHQGL
jgi:hypothetical protein